MATAAWSTDTAPSAKASITCGWVDSASASRAVSAARRGDSPHCQDSQWVNDFTPHPCQAPVANASDASSTKRACNTFNCPQTSRTRSSIGATGSVTGSETAANVIATPYTRTAFEATRVRRNLFDRR